MTEKRKWLKKSDIILIFLLIFISAAVFFFYSLFMGSKKASSAEILLDGKVVMTVPLNEDKVFSIEGKENVVFEIKDGAIRFSESDCPDKICIHTGFIKSASQTAVCLPNAISVRIISGSGNNNDVDVVVG